MYKAYTTNCTVCGTEFTYDRRVQHKGKFGGNWMGRGRETCSQACAKKRQLHKARTKAGIGNTRKARRSIVNRCCRKLGGAEGYNLNEFQILEKLEELIDYTIEEVPHDEVTVQQNYIDAVNDLLELGLINEDQQVKMLKIAEKWN